jgi:hypothetical protein
MSPLTRGIRRCKDGLDLVSIEGLETLLDVS